MRLPQPYITCQYECILYFESYCSNEYRRFPSAWWQEPRGARVRSLAGAWLLFSFVLGTVYRSNLKAMLILPRINFPFNSLEELTHTSIPCFVMEDTLAHKHIMVSALLLTVLRVVIIFLEYIFCAELVTGLLQLSLLISNLLRADCYCDNECLYFDINERVLQ